MPAEDNTGMPMGRVGAAGLGRSTHSAMAFSSSRGMSDTKMRRGCFRNSPFNPLMLPLSCAEH